MSALFAYAFREKKAHKLFAEAVDTEKSVALMKKLGMKEEGVQKQQVRNNDGVYCDLHFYGLLRETYFETRYRKEERSMQTGGEKHDF